MSNNNKSLTNNIITQHGRWMEHLTAQRTDYIKSGPLSVSLVTQKAKAAYAETLIEQRGTSEDVFQSLEAKRA